MNLQLRVGDVLNKSFSIWLKNLVPFTILTAIVYLPVILYMAFLLMGELTLQGITNAGYALVVGGLVLDFIAAAAVIYGVVQQLRGQHAGLGECLSIGIKRLLPVLAVGLLAALCVILGLVALIIPGIIISLMLCVAVPAAVVERPGVIGALKRSKELTDGHKGTLFAIFFILGIIDKVAGFVTEKIFLGGAADMGDVKIYLIATLAIAVVLGALGAVVTAVIYNELRRMKDGIEVDEIAKVFE